MYFKYLYMRLPGYVMRKSCNKLDICGKCLHDQFFPSNSCAHFNFTFEANKNFEKNNTNLLNSTMCNVYYVCRYVNVRLYQLCLHPLPLRKYKYLIIIIIIEQSIQKEHWQGF